MKLRDAANSGDLSSEQTRRMHQGRERGPPFDDDDVQPAVVQPRGGGDEGAVAVLTGVGDGNDHRVDTDRGAVGDDRVDFGLEGEQLLRGDFDVAKETTAYQAIGREAMCHTCVEADARDIEEEA